MGLDIGRVKRSVRTKINRDLIFSSLIHNYEPDGSWKARHGSERTHGANYATCMSLLALAVEYQYLPIYQR